MVVAQSKTPEFKGLTEGTDYTKTQILETIKPSNGQKPVFVEFFWYGCSHCFKMKDMSATLAKKYGSKIEYIKYPVGFPNWESGAKIFFTLEELNLEDKLHDKTFDEVHLNRNNILMDKKRLDTFLTKNGVDITKFNSIYNSFSVNSKWIKSQKMVVSHSITGSPNFAVYSGGYTYQTTPSLSGGYPKTIDNLDIILSSKIK